MIEKPMQNITPIHKAEQLWHGALDGIVEVVAAEEALHLGMVFLDP